MKKKNHDLKKQFKQEIFTKLCEKDIKYCGKPRHHLNSAYEAIDWICDNFMLVPKTKIELLEKSNN